MALRNLFQRDNDIDLTDAHIELVRFDLRFSTKSAYVLWHVWQSRDTAAEGYAPLTGGDGMIEMDWGLAELKLVHAKMKSYSDKGLLAEKRAIHEVAKGIDRDKFGGFSVTFGAIDADDVQDLSETTE